MSGLKDAKIFKNYSLSFENLVMYENIKNKVVAYGNLTFGLFIKGDMKLLTFPLTIISKLV